MRRNPELTKARTQQTSAHPDLLIVRRAEPLLVLSEVAELLDDYSPVWFTEDLRERLHQVLRTLRASTDPQSEVPTHAAKHNPIHSRSKD